MYQIHTIYLRCIRLWNMGFSLSALVLYTYLYQLQHNSPKFWAIYLDLYHHPVWLRIIQDYQAADLKLVRINQMPNEVWLLLACIIIPAIIALKTNPFYELYLNNLPHGSAKWANKMIIKKAGLLARKGLVLGTWKNRKLFLKEPLSILLLAPPGTGKSAGYAIPMLFKAKHSMVVLDVKAELYHTTQKYRSTMSKVLVFDPLNPQTKWNPLGKENLPEDKAEKAILVQNIATTIIQASGEKGDDYWITSARSLFTEIALALIALHGETTITAIYKATQTDDPEESRAKKIGLLAKAENLDTSIQNALNAYPKTAPAQFSGTIGTLDTKLYAFRDERVEEATSQSNFNFKELRKGVNGKPVTLYIIIKPDDVERLAPLIRLLFENMAKYFLSTPANKKKDYMVTLMLDEFARLGKLDQILQMPALSRGQYVNSIIIAQDAGQIETIYGNKGRETIFSTTAIKLVLSLNNEATASLFSKTIGNKTIKNISHSTGKSSSQSESEQSKPLISPQELMSLNFGKVIIIHQFNSQRPIMAKVPLWFKDHNSLLKAGIVPKRYSISLNVGLVYLSFSLYSNLYQWLSKDGWTWFETLLNHPYWTELKHAVLQSNFEWKLVSQIPTECWWILTCVALPITITQITQPLTKLLNGYWKWRRLSINSTRQLAVQAQEQPTDLAEATEPSIQSNQNNSLQHNQNQTAPKPLKEVPENAEDDYGFDNLKSPPNDDANNSTQLTQEQELTKLSEITKRVNKTAVYGD